MEEKFIAAWLAARQQAQALGIRLRPVEKEDMLASAHRQLTGLFSDEEANQALTRLLETGYFR